MPDGHPLTPPPVPTAPPPPPPRLIVRLVAAGSVGDYADTSALQQQFARVAGARPEAVSIAVEAASVRLTVTVFVEDGATIASTIASTSTALSNKG